MIKRHIENSRNLMKPMKCSAIPKNVRNMISMEKTGSMVSDMRRRAVSNKPQVLGVVLGGSSILIPAALMKIPSLIFLSKCLEAVPGSEAEEHKHILKVKILMQNYKFR